MKTLKIDSPKEWRMPGEYEPHRGTVLIWPVRPGSWPHGGRKAKEKFCEIAGILSRHEKVWMLSDEDHLQEARQMLSKAGENIQVVLIPTDDAWARDIGPTCVVDEGGEVFGIDWQFNAWGGTYDGLYADWRLDNQAAPKICSAVGIVSIDAQDLVLEGGSIASDGEGTLVVTSCCLLSQGRNPKLKKEQIEERLKEALGAKKVIWLPNGIYQDETNGHVDNVFAFTAPGEGVLAWTFDQEDPQYPLSLEDLQVLEREKDARGRTIRVHKLPIPKSPVCIQEEDLKGYVFAPGEEQRQLGERLAASYVNFYIANGAVLVPQFGDPSDQRATELLGSLFPGRRIYPVQTRCILVGGGNIHCITQQIPLGGYGKESGFKKEGGER